MHGTSDDDSIIRSRSSAAFVRTANAAVASSGDIRIDATERGSTVRECSCRTSIDLGKTVN
jgi:hypothetical protein